MEQAIETLLEKLHQPKIWDEQPVFCFTSDIDWASEAVLNAMFGDIESYNLKLTTFVTHHSDVINKQFEEQKIDRGIHPNFLSNSSHGNSFKEIIDTCIQFAPEAIGFRSHRLFDVTDITHLLKNEYGYKYVSNLGTIMATKLRALLHESGLVHLPIFFEDGTHLYQNLQLDFRQYKKYFETPGIKIICFHPMNYVFNSPQLSFMRNIKDSLTREAYNTIDEAKITQLRHNGLGIQSYMKQLFEWVLTSNRQVYSLNQIYQIAIS
jgi:hypothetical protein